MQVIAGGIPLEATLHWPSHPRGVVLFAHGSGSSRLSPRNRFVAEGLQSAGMATILLDLLTPEEEAIDQENRLFRFNIPLLGARLTGAVDWVIEQQGMVATAGQPSPAVIGLFGASTGAAAALITAAERPDAIGALVSRGGRPDLAAKALPKVRCPTLLIVGEADREVLAVNHQAAAALTAPHRLAVVPGASHLFEEPGALARVTTLAREWFCEFLKPAPP